jgi:hypothetical protein
VRKRWKWAQKQQKTTMLAQGDSGMTEARRSRQAPRDQPANAKY